MAASMAMESMTMTRAYMQHAAHSSVPTYILHMQENFLEAELLSLQQSRMYVVQQP